jgi:hypothetical protein
LSTWYSVEVARILVENKSELKKTSKAFPPLLPIILAEC